MKRVIRKIQARRVFSEEVKKKVVKLYETGQNSVAGLSKIYEVSGSSIYEWIYRYSEYEKQSLKIVEMKDSMVHKVKVLESKIKELERIIGRKQIKIDFYDKMIEIGKEEFNIDLLKNLNTSQSTGSEETETK